MPSLHILKRPKNEHLLFLVLVALDLFLFLTVCIPAAEVNQFFVRDIYRTKAFLAGHFLGVGPDFTSGTYAPGPFYYILLAPIVALTLQAKFIILYLFSIKLAAQYFLCRALEKVTSASFLFTFLLLSASPVLLRPFYWPNNAALIIPLTQVLCLLAIQYFVATPSLQVKKLLGMSIFLSLSIQVHFSLILALPLLLFLIGEKNITVKSRLQEVGLFFLAFTIPLIPFGVSIVTSSFSSGEGPIFYVDDFGFSFFFKAWGLQIGRTFFQSPNMDIFYFLHIGVFFFTVLKGAWIIISKQPQERSFTERLFVRLASVTFLMSAWILSGRTMRYYSMLFTISYLFLVLEFYQLLRKHIKSHTTPLILAVALFFSSWGVLYNFYKNLGLVAKCENCIIEVEKICALMNERKVSYQEFLNSTYEILAEYNEGSAALTGECFAKQEGSLGAPSKRFLLVHSNFLADEIFFDETLRQLPPEIKNIYKKERLHPELKTEGFTFFSVTIDPVELGPFKQLSNLAFVYDLDPAFGEKYQLERIKNSEYLTQKAQLCPTALFCDLFISSQFKNGILSLSLRSRIFQTKYDLDPVAAEASGLKLAYTCDGKEQTLELISKLGAVDGVVQNRTFFTPLQANFTLPCKELKLSSLLTHEIRLFHTKTGMDHLFDQKYSLEMVP